MSFVSNITLVVERIGAEFRTLRAEFVEAMVFLQGNIDSLSDVVATKAAQENVDAQLASKANATDLDNVFGIATGAAATAATKVTGLNGVTGLWKGTTAEYNAIATKDPNVYYVVLP